MSTGAFTDQIDYPLFAVDHIQNPNRLWAFPIVGGTIKTIIVLPVAIWIMIIAYVALILSVVNSFIVLFTGQYWRLAYDVAVGSMRLSTKANLFLLGLSDKYPGFSFSTSDEVRLEIAMPTQPSRAFALPLLGGFVRILLLIPFIIFLYIIGIVVLVVYWIAWIPVLFTGQYPQGLFDFMVYVMRLQLRMSCYTFGLSDRYPRFGS
jgi:hypothetical protein